MCRKCKGKDTHPGKDGDDMNIEDLQRARAHLAEPFENEEVKPAQVRQRYGQKGQYEALALSFISREHVQNRLDDVLGPENWETTFEVIDAKNYIIQCGIGIRVDGQGEVWKYDVGCDTGASTNDDPGNSFKGAYSDAFKRAATHWDVGRYLYDKKPEWLPCEVWFKQGESKPRFKRWLQGANPTTGELPAALSPSHPSSREATPPEMSSVTPLPTVDTGSDMPDENGGGEPRPVEVTGAPEEWVELVKKLGFVPKCNTCNAECYPKRTRAGAMAAWCAAPSCASGKYRGYCYSLDKAMDFNTPEAEVF